jgi:hypothetical protein
MASLRLHIKIALFCAGTLLLPKSYIAQETSKDLSAMVDTDHDGLSDALEQTLLLQFQPEFQVGRLDCSNLPAEFAPDIAKPTVKLEDGTIYGQAFLSKLSTKDAPMAELHFYHLWKIDCGEHGHPLDTEHVAVLVRASSADLPSAHWHALYWYAAAHENTVCDVSQIARASTLDAVDHGAKVWISPGKHASYLNKTLCQRGCGADRCESMVPLVVSKIVNLGEVGHPMNGSTFLASTEWPLEGKMMSTNFPAEPLTRLDRMPATDIAWFNPGRHPAQQIISISALTGGKIANSGGDTTAAINLAEDSTGNALHKSYRKTKHALGKSAQNVGKALHITPKTEDTNPGDTNEKNP